MVRALIAILLLSATARAEVRTYLLVIGNNAAPPANDGDGQLEPLRYADDDAADFYSFFRPISAGGTLLAVLDTDSQKRFPELAAEARAPSLAELRAAVARLQPLFVADRAAGHDPVLLFFYSGHGTRGGGVPALTLLDGALTQEVLYSEVLAALPARYAHLFVDACHAEAVVRSRDLEAQTVSITPSDVESYASRSTLARFPHVGAVVATSSAGLSHEWDVYQRGVFSHELLSALRGAADVNGDLRIEYSELSAFLSAANREVADPRAHLAVVTRPPALNPRVPLVDLKALRGGFRLSGRAAVLGSIYIEDELGNRLLDLHAEVNSMVNVVLPAVRRLYVRGRLGEAVIEPRPDTTVAFDEMRFARRTTVARGSVEDALHRGLFAASYGPAYYRGYVDKATDFVPVPAVVESAPPPTTLPRPTPIDPMAATRQKLRLSRALYGTAGTFTVLAAVLGGLAASQLATLSATDLERPATTSRQNAINFGAPAAASIALAAVSAGVATWLYLKVRRSPLKNAAVVEPAVMRW
jgi:hypothetical protein